MNCVVYNGHQTISMCTVFRCLKLGNFLLKMIPVLEGLKTSVTKANIPAVKIVVEQDARLSKM